MDIEQNEIRIQPLTDANKAEVNRLFHQHPFKDFQLNQLKIPKEKMVAFLKKSLNDKNIRSIYLREGDKLSGVIAAKYLPWMSELFNANMVSLQHFIAIDQKSSILQTILHYFIEHSHGIDFIDCRVSTADVNAIQTLEDNKFRFVGNEVYMVRSLKKYTVPDQPGQQAWPITCPEEMQPLVIELARDTHFHNRYMYDPEVPPDKSKEIYGRYLAGFGFNKDFRSLISVEHGRVRGFIFYKFNRPLSNLVGRKYASLDFIGVSPEFQNAGIGHQLNQAALADLVKSGASHVVVRTFGSNYPAIRILHKSGFKITSSDLHFHLWLRPKAMVGNSLHSSAQPF